MTVKLAKHTKDNIRLVYTRKTLTIKEMTQFFGVSSRTIGRVLEEGGLATPVPRLKGEAHQVMLLLKKHNLTPVTLTALLEAPPLVPQIQDVPALLDKLTFADLLRNFTASAMKKLLETSPGTSLEKQPITQPPTSQTAVSPLPLAVFTRY